MAATPGVWMYKWNNNHLMETTSNPVESCMKWLNEDLFGMGKPREASLFNRYRMLVMWLLYCDNNRRVAIDERFRIVATRYGLNEVTPWAIKTLIENAHFVECYRDSFIVEKCPGNLRSNEIREWDGKKYGMDANVEGSCYRLIDTKTRLVYTVDTAYMIDPCPCHRTHWQKVPCVHVMMVLRHLQEFDKVWQYFGEEYEVRRVKETCSRWTEKDREFFGWLSKMGLQGEDGLDVISRVTERYNGRNKRRIPSTGESIKKWKKVFV